MDWNSFLLGENEWPFLLDTAIRTTFMFIVLLAGLRMLGKKSVSQLSVFELGVLIGLGSAAGDPMFYKEVGVIPSVVVLAVIIILYRFINYIMNKAQKIEDVLEGIPTVLIENGEFCIDNFEKEIIARDELFSSLRQNQVSHLGQVKLAIAETTGHISIFYFENDEIKSGLPIIPDKLKQVVKNINEQGNYSCFYCGHTRVIAQQGVVKCSSCNKNEWIKAASERRIT